MTMDQCQRQSSRAELRNPPLPPQSSEEESISATVPYEGVPSSWRIGFETDLKASASKNRDEFPFTAAFSFSRPPQIFNITLPAGLIPWSPPQYLCEMDDIYARFNPNPTKIAAWSQLLMLGSTPNSAPDVLYTRAIPIFLHWRDNLIKFGWRNVPDEQLPSGLLFVVESHRHYSAREAFTSGKTQALGLSPSSSSDSICETLSSHQRTLRPTEVTRFALPADLSAFLEYGEDIQESFRNPVLFNPVLDPRNNLVLAIPDELDHHSTAAFRDMFYLLQLIVPGMFLLVHDALSFSEQKRSSSLLVPPLGSQRSPQRLSVPRAISPNLCGSVESRASPRILLRRTRRALPPAEWMMSKTEVLEGIFGKSLLHELLICARDVELTVWSTVNGPDGDPLDSGSDAGFEPPMSPAGSWSDPEEVSGSIAIPSASHTRRYRDRYSRRAYSL